MDRSERARTHHAEAGTSLHPPSVRSLVASDIGSHAADWLRRYGLAELLGIAGALVAVRMARAADLPHAAVGYAGAIGENAGFYCTIVSRQILADRQLVIASGGRYGSRALWCTMRELLLEFGPAELLDSLVVRPFAMALGVRVLGPTVGVVAGKLVADLTFYLPVVVTYESRRRARAHLHS